MPQPKESGVPPPEPAALPAADPGRHAREGAPFQVLDEFLAVLAHELRNPLAGVRNAVRLLDSDDPRVLARAREIIDRQSAYMARMVEDLLDLSRVAHGKVHLRPEPRDLAALARDCIEVTAPQRAVARQTLEASIAPGPVWVLADGMRLEQVFTNLLNNSSKFTREGGHVWLSVAEERGADDTPHAVVRVRDDGAGIEPTLLPRIFDLFVQDERHAERGRTGIGLGLTVARRLVELQGGRLEAHSEGVERGSEFVVTLPLLPRPRVGASPRGARRAAPRAASPRRILVVDDNRDAAESMRLMYSLAGHEVRVVYEGAQAVQAAADMRSEVVLLDIGMPDMDGFAVAHALRDDARTRDALVIAVTGYGRESDVHKGREAGFDAHVTKPVDPDHVLALIERGRAATA